MNDLLKLTLDSNCIINLFDHRAETPTSVDELAELMRLGLSGKVSISVTTRIGADLENDTNEERRKAILHSARMFPVIGTVARLNVTRFDSGDVFGGEETSLISDDLRKILFPGGIDKQSATFTNKINDLDHLLGHFINKRDIFVTDDKGILKKKQALKTNPGIIVMSPSEVIMYVEKLEGGVS